MFKRDVLLAIHNFRELKSLANNAKIRSSLKFLLIRYFILPRFVVYWINLIYTQNTENEYIFLPLQISYSTVVFDKAYSANSGKKT